MAEGAESVTGSWFRFRLRAIQESGSVLRRCQRGGSEPGDRAPASGARGGGGRQRAGGQSGWADQPDRRRDRTVAELDALRVPFDTTRITSIDWQTYPILRFNSVPDSIEVHIINRPGQPFLGSGETGQGPAAASIANAIANATGKRLRNLPLTRKRIKDAIGV